MDPNLVKLGIAQELIQGLLGLLPPTLETHAKAQALLSAAQTKISSLEVGPPVPPLVVPQFVPAAAAK